MRLHFCALLTVALIGSPGCGGAEKEAEKDDVNEAVAGKFRTTWANTDVATRSEAGSDIRVCMRLTTLPGPCRFARQNYSGGDATYSGVFDDTCDINIQDSAVHIGVQCETETPQHGCSAKEFEADVRTLDQTNSKTTLTGEETTITGLGDQDWRVGAALCDEVFAQAKKDQGLRQPMY